MKNFAMMMLTVIALASCQDDPNPAVERLTDINVQEGNYAISYDGNGDVSLVQYFEGGDVTTYSFTWSENNYKLVVLSYIEVDDPTTHTFEYLDVKVDEEIKKVIHKVIFDDSGDGGNLVQVDYIAAPNESIPSIIESFTYFIDDESDAGTATWTETDTQIVLDYSTNEEVVKINFHNSIDAWWTKIPAEIMAVLFENEFHYPYFLSMKEVTSIENTYFVKETPDYNDTFEYQYGSNGSILSIENTVQRIMFDWTKK